MWEGVVKMFEISRNVKFKNILMFAALGLAVLILGMVLLVTIDKVRVSYLTYKLTVESLYTVITQFGPIVFSPIIIYFISNDYKENLIYFYEKLNYSASKYFTNKILSLFVLFGITSLCASLLTSLYFNNFSLTIIVFLKIFSVIMLYVIIASFFAYFFDSFVKSFFTNFIFWIIGIIISASGGIAEAFAYYDAANTDYKDFIKFLDGEKINIIRQIMNSYIYNIVVFIACIMLVWILRERWKKNGI